jgi:hypothetical protein
MDKFWEAASGKLVDRWAAVSVPALVYWLGGLTAWAYGHGGVHMLTNWLDRQTAPTRVVTILTILLGVAASGVVVQQLSTPVLRALEGYWPSWLGRLRKCLVDRVERRAAEEDAAWQRLYLRLHPPATPTPDELSQFARLDRRRRRRPNSPSRYMPTKTGNILRAAETWPTDKYGLDAVAVWPRLWLVLPDPFREELHRARAALDNAVSAVIWALLFCAFAFWTPLVIAIGLVVAVAAVKVWVPARAEVFGDLVEAAYDVYRTALYRQLRWPLPTDPEQERSQGEQLTAYLWRGSEKSDPTFTPPP